MKYRASLINMILFPSVGVFLILFSICEQAIKKPEGWTIFGTVFLLGIGLLCVMIIFIRIELTEVGLNSYLFRKGFSISYNEMTLLVWQFLPFPGYILCYYHDGRLKTKLLLPPSKRRRFEKEIRGKCPSLKIKGLTGGG